MMSNREKEVLLEKLTKPEASDGVGFGVVAAGLLAIGMTVTGASVIPAAVAAIGIAGPVLLAIGLGGMGVMGIYRLLQPRPQVGPQVGHQD